MKVSARSVPVLCLALAACGGGGGGDGGAPGPRAPVSGSFPITADNAAPVTAESWKAANGSAGFVEFAGASEIVSIKPGAHKPAAGMPSSRSLVYLVQKIPFGPETFPCQQAGSVTLSGNLASSTTLSAGDEIDVVADACDDGLGEVLDGSMNMHVDAFAGDLFAGVYELTLTLTLTNMQVTTAAGVETSNGAATVELDTLAMPLILAAVSGDAMTVDSDSASLSLTDFSSQRTLDTGTQPLLYTLQASGAVDSSLLPGAVEYSTPTEFAGYASAFPHAGELLVAGENSSARLVVLDDVNVRIDIDLDGNGTVDESIETSWEALVN